MASIKRRMRGGVAARAAWLALLSLLGVLAHWKIAWAQAELRRVSTDTGVTVAVPAGLRQVPGLAALPGGSRFFEGLAAFTDDGDAPLSVLVRSGAEHDWESLPGSQPKAIAAEWTRRFAEALDLPEAYDVVPGSYDAKRGQITVKYKVLGPSFARLMLGVPDEHPLWAPTIDAREDPKHARCLLAAFLAGQPSASEAELRVRLRPAANQCGLPEAMVDGYREQLGPEEFEPAVTTVTYLSFFTRGRSIAVLVFAPLERQQAVDEVAGLIGRETEVAPASLLPVTTDRLFRVFQLAGIVLGSVLAVLVLGGGLSWLLLRLGVPTSAAVGSTLGLLCALTLIGMLRAGKIHVEGVAQAGTYLLTSAFAFRPCVDWFESRKSSLSANGSWLSRARSKRNTRGASMVEYIVLLGVVALLAIGAWRVFSQSMRSTISKEARQVATLEATVGVDTGGVDRSATAGGVRRPGSGSNTVGASGRAAGASGPAAASGGSSASSLGEAAATGVAQGMAPGSVVTSAARPALPAKVGPVLAAAAKEPSLLLRGIDIGTDLLPIIGNVKDGATALSGINPVTKEHASPVERVVAGVFAVPGLGNLAKYIGKGAKYVFKGGKAAYEGVVAVRAASKVARAAERELAQAVVEGAEKEAAKRAEHAVAARVEKEAAERAEKETADKVAKEAADKAAGVAFTRPQLQHAYKHASDFGVSGNMNNQTLDALKAAIERHVAAPGTRAIVGEYRGLKGVTHFIDPSTGLNVIRDSAGNFVSGWKLSPQQLQYVLTTGKLGGG